MGAIAVQIKPHQGRTAPGDWLDGALAPWLEAVATAPGGESLSLTLRPAGRPVRPRPRRSRRPAVDRAEGRVFQRGGRRGVRRHRRGSRRAACRRWLRQGEPRGRPSPSSPRPRPRWRRRASQPARSAAAPERGPLCLVLTGFRDSRPAAALSRQWGTFCGLTAPAGQTRKRRSNGRKRRPTATSGAPACARPRKAIRAGTFDKVVLARKRVITLRAPIDVDALARRMAQACEGGRVLKMPSHNGHPCRDSGTAGGEARARPRQPCARGNSGRFAAPSDERKPRETCSPRRRKDANTRWWCSPSPGPCARSATTSGISPSPA